MKKTVNRPVKKCKCHKKYQIRNLTKIYTSNFKKSNKITGDISQINISPDFKIVSLISDISCEDVRLGYVRGGHAQSIMVMASSFHLTNSSNRHVGISECRKA
jgi:hypothetical protein